MKQGLGRAYAGSHFKCIGVTFIRSRETVSIFLLLQGFCEESEQLAWQSSIMLADMRQNDHARYVAGLENLMIMQELSPNRFSLEDK